VEPFDDTRQIPRSLVSDFEPYRWSRTASNCRERTTALRTSATRKLSRRVLASAANDGVSHSEPRLRAGLDAVAACNRLVAWIDAAHLRPECLPEDGSALPIESNRRNEPRTARVVSRRDLV
jgi:hypothetical protein